MIVSYAVLTKIDQLQTINFGQSSDLSPYFLLSSALPEYWQIIEEHLFLLEFLIFKIADAKVKGERSIFDLILDAVEVDDHL